MTTPRIPTGTGYGGERFDAAQQQATGGSAHVPDWKVWVFLTTITGAAVAFGMWVASEPHWWAYPLAIMAGVMWFVRDMRWKRGA
jgi:Flp pilus assembly protein TadB